MDYVDRVQLECTISELQAEIYKLQDRLTRLEYIEVTTTVKEVRKTCHLIELNAGECFEQGDGYVTLVADVYQK